MQSVQCLLPAGDGGLGPVAAPGAPHGVPDHPISTAYHSVPDYRTTSLARLARLARWRCGGAVGVGRRGGARVGARGSHFGPNPPPHRLDMFYCCMCELLEDVEMFYFVRLETFVLPIDVTIALFFDGNLSLGVSGRGAVAQGVTLPSEKIKNKQTNKTNQTTINNNNNKNANN